MPSVAVCELAFLTTVLGWGKGDQNTDGALMKT